MNVFDTRYEVQWLVDDRLSGEPVNLPRTELFRKKPVVTKPIIKAWLPEVATCETIQVLLSSQQANLPDMLSNRNRGWVFMQKLFAECMPIAPSRLRCITSEKLLNCCLQSD